MVRWLDVAVSGRTSSFGVFMGFAPVEGRCNCALCILCVPCDIDLVKYNKHIISDTQSVDLRNHPIGRRSNAPAPLRTEGTVKKRLAGSTREVVAGASVRTVFIARGGLASFGELGT